MNEIERLKSIDVNGAIAQALREQAERESGCEWCLDDEDNEPEHIGIGTDEWGRECGYLVIGEETFQVNFCPMCGRKLDGGGQDARKGESHEDHI